MKHLDAMRWSLWGMAAFGLGDTRGGTGGERGDSKSNSGGRSSSPGAGSKSSGASSGSTSSGRSSSASSSSSAGRSASSGSTASSSSRSAGASSGGGFGGGEGGEGRSKGSSVGSRSSAGTSSTAGSAARGTSSGSVGAGASGGSMGPSTSRGTTSGAVSTGRQAGGTVGGGLGGAVGLTGSGMADKGGRVTGGFDSGRFGDTPAAEKGGRVTGADPGRFGSRASVGRQSSVGGSFANGGVSSDRAGAAARVGNGLAAGISAPSISARDAETKSMRALSASRAVPSSNPRQAEDKSLADLHSYDREVVGVVSAGPGRTQVQRRDGTVETRVGPRASRNNNPGNLEYGEFAVQKGAVGTDGRFAVFSSPAQGQAAMEGLLEGPKYSGLSISEAINRYAPSHENNSKKYAETVARAAGVPTDTRLSALAPEQRSALVSEMTRVEGNQPYSTTTQKAGTPRGVAPTNTPSAKADRFGKTYLSASAAIEGVAPADTPKRATGLAAVSPSFGRFDKTGLSESVISVANAIGAAVPGASVISGYRNPSHNAKVGGAKKSQHMQGQAVDIDMRGWTDDERRAALSAAVQAGAQGIGIYNNGTSLHVDTRPGSKAMWGGNPAGQYKGMSIEQAPSWSRDILSGWQGEPTKGARVTAASAPAPDLPAPRNVADRPVATADRFADKYLGPASVPTPTARPDYTPARSTADKVLAGAIDLGVGLIPGVGLAAGIYSAAGPLVGLPSIGEMALNVRDRNQFNVSADARKQGDGVRGDRDVEDRLRGAAPLARGATAPVEPESPAPVAASERFEEKYLAFSDPTPRLTPGEKWGGSGANDVRYAL